MGIHRQDVPIQARCTDTCKKELLRVVPPVSSLVGLTAHDRDADWLQALRSDHDKVVGMVLLEPVKVCDPMLVLSRPLLELRKYWLATRHFNDPLLLLRVVQASRIAAKDVRASVLASSGNALFWKLSPLSAAKLAETPVAHDGETTLQQVVDHHASLHGTHERPVPLDLCWSMPLTLAHKKGSNPFEQEPSEVHLSNPRKLSSSQQDVSPDALLKSKETK